VVLDGYASLIVPSSKGGYIVSSLRKLCHLDWDTQTVTDLHEVPVVGTEDRFNDGKCDPMGRLWAGTMGYESTPGQPEIGKGSLFLLNKGQLSTKVSPVSISNGLAWSHDKTIMYYIDSIPRVVYAYDYDNATGDITNQRVAVDFNRWSIAEVGLPDGMTIDMDGKLWVAGYLSSKVMQFDPTNGALLRSITVPGIRTTSCCFGGKDYSELYVTSARQGWTEEEFRTKDPQAGSLFRITGLGAKGGPANIYCAE